jgi:hypothetical protein
MRSTWFRQRLLKFRQNAREALKRYFIDRQTGPPCACADFATRPPLEFRYISATPLLESGRIAEFIAVCVGKRFR